MSKTFRGGARLVVDAEGKAAATLTERGTRVVMVASSESEDRDGETIDANGWHWDEANLPPLLWGHDARNPQNVLGKLTRVWIDDGQLMIEAQFNDDLGALPGGENAALIGAYMRAGRITQGSVGFIPDSWVGADGRKYERNKDGLPWGSEPGRKYTRQELVEFSIVPVPSQRDSALVQVRELFGAIEPPAAPATPREDTKEPAVSWFDKLFGPSRHEKAGAVLSRANKDRLSNARDAIEAAAEAIEEVLQSAERADDEEAPEEEVA